VNRDAFILQETREEMESVLAPQGLWCRQPGSATNFERNLDLVVMFSSITGTMGKRGPDCDMPTAAIGFLDAYAEHREFLRWAKAEAVREDFVHQLASLGRGLA